MSPGGLVADEGIGPNFFDALHESAYGTKRTIASFRRNVCFVPIGDISHLTLKRKRSPTEAVSLVRQGLRNSIQRPYRQPDCAGEQHGHAAERNEAHENVKDQGHAPCSRLLFLKEA
jgi:hypothetical protein